MKPNTLFILVEISSGPTDEMFNFIDPNFFPNQYHHQLLTLIGHAKITYTLSEIECGNQSVFNML